MCKNLTWQKVIECWSCMTWQKGIWEKIKLKMLKQKAQLLAVAGIPLLFPCLTAGQACDVHRPSCIFHTHCPTCGISSGTTRGASSIIAPPAAVEVGNVDEGCHNAARNSACLVFVFLSLKCGIHLPFNKICCEEGFPLGYKIDQCLCNLSLSGVTTHCATARHPRYICFAGAWYPSCIHAIWM